MAHREEKRVKMILIAPTYFLENEDDKRRDLYDFKLPDNASKIAEEIVMFGSNDFPHHRKSFELYMKTLRRRVIQLENKVHFLFFQMGTNEFPELLKEVIG